MTSSREEILANFQACTNMDDVEQCISMLNAHNWDLGSAVSTILAEDHDTSERIVFDETVCNDGVPQFSDISAQSIDNRPSGSTIIRQLHFVVTCGEKVISLVVPDTQTVGDVQQRIASHLKISYSNIRLKGWSKNVKSSTSLKSLNLPQQINLVASVLCRNGTEDCLPSSTLQTSCSSFTNASVENCKPKCSASKQLYQLNIHIKDPTRPRTVKLHLDGTASISRVKHDLYNICGIPACRQHWEGWPQNVLCAETTLNDACIDRTHDFFVECKPDNSVENDDFCVPDAVDTASEPDYYDDALDLLEGSNIEDFERVQASLIADNQTDITAGTCTFAVEFKRRYCESPIKTVPPFHIGSLEDALATTLMVPVGSQKPLFIYLHHGGSVQVNIFCSQVLTDSSITAFFFNNDYTIWPWDITHAKNADLLYQSLVTLVGSNAVSALRNLEIDQLPLILVIGRSRASFEIIQVIMANRSPEMLLTSLVAAQYRFHEAQEAEMLAEMERARREEFRREQDNAYQESLLLDQKKELDKQIEEQLKRDSKMAMEEQEKLVEEDRQREIEKAKSMLVEEPSAACTDVLVLRFRMPTSAPPMTRRFLKGNSLANLVTFVESLGFLRRSHKIITTYPRCSLLDSYALDATLEEMNIPNRETLIIEEI